MNYHVYFLQSEKDKKLYIGCTSKNPLERLKEHNKGMMKSTKSRRPFKLIFSEKYKDNESAYKREWYLKSPKGYKEKIRITKKFMGS